MTPPLYEASAPVFLRYLSRLEILLDAAESHLGAQGIEPSRILAARLAPDMLPFEMQVTIAANFALRACFPLTGQAIPPYGEFAAGFDGLRSRIHHVMALLKALEPSQFDGAASLALESKAGNAVVSLPGAAFLLQYALPNFFFHVTTAYAILRSQGVPVGKADFDGFHAYEPGP